MKKRENTKQNQILRGDDRINTYRIEKGHKRILQASYMATN